MDLGDSPGAGSAVRLKYWAHPAAHGRGPDALVFPVYRRLPADRVKPKNATPAEAQTWARSDQPTNQDGPTSVQVLRTHGLSIRSQCGS